MGEPGETDSETESLVAVYRRLRLHAVESFPDIVEEAVVERNPGSAPRTLRVFLVDGSFLDVWISEEKYSFHWQSDAQIIRFDNAPHHDEVDTFPHHRHVDGNVEESSLGDDHVENLETVLTFVRDRVKH